MSAAQLKYLAAAAMLIDHVGWLFEPMAALAGPDDLMFYLFRYVGRLAFPIFAFFAAEGCHKTGNFPRYLLRLGLFGGATHLLVFLASGGTGGSVIATFFLAALGIFLCEKIMATAVPRFLALLPALGLALLAEALHTDYGLLGVALVLCLYFCGESRRRQLACLGVFMVLLYLAGSLFEAYAPALEDLLRGVPPALVWSGVRPYLPRLFGFYLPHALLMTLCACAALVPLARYDGRRGRGRKWFFYWFYPGHLAVLFLLKAIFF